MADNGRVVKIRFLGDMTQLQAALARAGVVADEAGKKFQASANMAANAARQQAAAAGGSADEQAAAAGRAAAAWTEASAKMSAAQKAAGRAAADAAAMTGAAVDVQEAAFRRAVAQQAQYEGAVAKSAAAAKAAGVAHAAALGTAAKFGKGVAKVGLAGFAVAAYEGTKGAMNLQRAMEMLHTQAGASQQQVNALTNAVLHMAGSVGTSPNDLASGMYHVVSSLNATLPAATRTATELRVLRVAAEGAKVGNANLVDVTNALDSAVVSGIGGVHNFSQAMGALNTVVGAGDMTMQDLADALGTGILGPMKTYGMSLRDVGAALAVFGDNNIRGQDAATKLISAVRIMAAPSIQASKYFGALGLSVTQLGQDIRSGGIVKALADLKAHLQDSGLTATQQGVVISRAFGGRQSTGVQVLLQQFDRLKAKYGEIGAGASHFGQSWSATTQTAAFKASQLHAKVQALSDEFGAVLIPKELAVANATQNVIRWFERHKAVSELLAATIGGVLATALTVYAYTKAVAFVGATKDMIAGIGALATKAGEGAAAIAARFGLIGSSATAMAGEVATADGAAITATEGLAAGVASADSEIVAANATAGRSFTALLGPIGVAAAAVLALHNQINDLTGGGLSGKDNGGQLKSKIYGLSGQLNQSGKGTGLPLLTPGPPGSTRYVSPFMGGHVSQGRTDMGVDFSATPGTIVRAIGGGVIDAIVRNWFKGQPLVEERLTSGPRKGQHVYYAEQISPSVRVGQHVGAGGRIGTVASSGTGLELGFGAGGGRTLAQATTGYREGQVTPAGRAFARFLASLSGGGGGGGTSSGGGGSASPGLLALINGTGAGKGKRKTGAAAISNPSEAHIASYLIHSMGLSPTVVAGMLGNFAQESHFNASLNGPSGLGIAQWMGKRRAAIEAMAAREHVAPNTLGVQLQYLAQELHGSYAGTLAAMRHAKSPQQAADIFMRTFERPAPNSANAPNREAQAAGAYALLTGHGSSGANRARNAALAKFHALINTSNSILTKLTNAIQSGTAKTLMSVLGVSTGHGVAGSIHGAIEGLPSTARAGRVDAALVPMLTRAARGSTQEKAFDHEVAALRHGGQGAVAKALVAAHKAAMRALAQEMYAEQVSKDAESLNMQAQKLRDQTTMLQNAEQAKIDIAKAQEQKIVDAMDAQVTVIRDWTQIVTDKFSGMVQAIQDATQQMSDANNAVVQGINDQTQIKVDILGERGLYGLNLIAQQLRVQADITRAFWDQQIALAQQNLDRVTATEHAAVNAAQIALDQTQLQQDQLVAQAQLVDDTVKITQLGRIAAAQAHMDAVTLHMDTSVVGPAQIAVDMNAAAPKAVRDVMDAQLKRAEGVAGKAEGAASQQYLGVYVEAQGAIGAADKMLSTTQANAQAVIAAAGQALATIQGEANVAIATATQTLTGVQGQAGTAEATSSGAADVAGATASTQFAGGGLIVNMYGIPLTNAAAVGSTLDWFARNTLALSS